MNVLFVVAVVLSSYLVAAADQEDYSERSSCWRSCFSHFWGKERVPVVEEHIYQYLSLKEIPTYDSTLWNIFPELIIHLNGYSITVRKLPDGRMQSDL